MKISIFNLFLLLLVLCKCLKIEKNENKINSTYHKSNVDLQCSICQMTVLSYNYSGKLSCEFNDLCNIITDKLRKIKIENIINNFTPCNICFRVSLCHIEKCKEMSEIQQKIIENLVISNNNEIDYNLIEKFTSDEIEVIYGLSNSINNKFNLMKTEIKSLNKLVKNAINVYFSKKIKKRIIIDVLKSNKPNFKEKNENDLTFEELTKYTNTISTLFTNSVLEFEEKYSEVKIILNKLSSEENKLSERNKSVLNEEINKSLDGLMKKINNLILVYNLLKKLAYKIILYK